MGRRVLVVDDDRGIRESFQVALDGYCEVLVSSTSAEALAILKAQPIDLVVLDYCLPDRPGSNVLQMIKREWSAVPVIVITAYGSESLCAELFRLGARAYFSKPYDVDAVLGTIRTLLAVPKRRRRQNVLRALPPIGSSGRAREIHPGIQTALLWIQANYAEPMALPDVARLAGMSPFHFCRQFKALVGHGFHQHVIALRLEKAKELLRASTDRVAEVAFAVGFSDLSSFYKAFHRATGRSPSAWRRAARSTGPSNLIEQNRKKT